MPQINRRHGINRRLLALEFFLRLSPNHALEILDAHEQEVRLLLNADKSDPRFRMTCHRRRLLRDKLRRIERVRVAVDAPKKEGSNLLGM